jgi:hypothetical protein
MRSWRHSGVMLSRPDRRASLVGVAADTSSAGLPQFGEQVSRSRGVALGNPEPALAHCAVRRPWRRCLGHGPVVDPVPPPRRRIPPRVLRKVYTSSICSGASSGPWGIQEAPTLLARSVAPTARHATTRTKPGQAFAARRACSGPAGDGNPPRYAEFSVEPWKNDGIFLPFRALDGPETGAPLSSRFPAWRAQTRRCLWSACSHWGRNI